MNNVRKSLFGTVIAAVAILGGGMLSAAPAAAAPVGSCSSGPYYDHGSGAGIASCNGSFWRVNVGCWFNPTVYGAWGGARTAVTYHPDCRDNWGVWAEAE